MRAGAGSAGYSSLPEGNAILVTGSHRSGSTWVGKMLALSRHVGYIHEPFGTHHRPGQCAAGFQYWFPYITSENEAAFLRPVANMLAFRYGVRSELKAVRSCRDAGRFVRDSVRFAYHGRTGVRPLLKDPLAVFSAEWLASRFGVQPVMVIRHPAAFANSLKTLGWTHPFSHFLAQPLLMRDVLAPYHSKIEEFAAGDPPILDQAILLWQLVHHAIRQYRERHPNWVYVRHEDVSRNPIDRFQEIFHRLNLPFESTIERQISKYSSTRNPVECLNPLSVRRNSEENVLKWQHTLSTAEICKIRRAVEPLSQEFYSDEDWDTGGTPASAPIQQKIRTFAVAQ